MLPSTGYFKGLSCPFYDSGLCERPYCHFRHVKKDASINPSNEGNESGAILQKLVSAAVQRVLQQTEGSASTAFAAPGDGTSDVNKVNNAVQSKATYNPTPIAQLNKINSVEEEDNIDANDQKRRHIPVPYTPRKPVSAPIKRAIDTNGSISPFVYNPPAVKYTPGCSEAVEIDQYTPEGSVESTEKYLPGVELDLPEYTPKDTQLSNKHNYVPSDRSVSKKKILEYKPTKVSSSKEIPTVTYQPTPRFLAPCFSSDEDEPDIKKAKLLNGLDELKSEFDILDQILDEEKADELNNILDNSKEQSSEPELSSKNKIKAEASKSSKDTETSKDRHKNHKKSSDKSSNHKSHDKSKSKKDGDKLRKEKLHSKDKSEDKNKESSKRDSSKSHKSSSKDKEKAKEKEKEKGRIEKDSKSSKTDKHSSKSSKQSEDRTSKTEKHSKHSKDSSRDRHKEKSKHKHSKKDDENRHGRDEKSSKKKVETLMNVPDSDFANDTEFDQRDEHLYNISSESDEEAIALECKKIFEEYVPENKTVEETSSMLIEDNSESEYVPVKKRISRTTETKVKIIPKPPVKPDFKVSAAQTMAERLTKVREFHASKNIVQPSCESVPTKPEFTKPMTVTSSQSHSKIRIAHVPYASTMMNAKRGIAPTPPKKDEPTPSSTLAQTVKKGNQRVAHIPSEKFIDRPGVLEPLASRIPANIRSTYLNLMIDECLKIYLSSVDAYARAQHEELATSKKCSTVQIYKNSAVLTINRLRKEMQECNGIKKTGSECSALQKLPQSLSGHSGQAGSWSIENKNRRVFDNSHEFTGARFYNNIKKWILTDEQLQENGFPQSHVSGEKGRAIIYGQNKQKPPKGFIRTCCRCKKEYTIDKKGFPAVKQECIYHPNNKYRVRGEAKYQCCSQDGSSDGCCIAPCHVYEYVDFENLKGFVKTLPPERDMDDYGVYALDCEMCYTTHGLDLTRVTVINSACKVIYETLIRPLHPIIDYNTRYSGITEEQMVNVRTTLLEVQATLLAMFNSKTILIGHSLESDFKALKLIHESVIDTSVLFPHKMGPPFKRALRNLSSEYLKKIIQNSVDGHDSAEDARACMELIIYKLKEDLKTR